MPITNRFRLSRDRLGAVSTPLTLIESADLLGRYRYVELRAVHPARCGAPSDCERADLVVYFGRGEPRPRLSRRARRGVAARRPRASPSATGHARRAPPSTRRSSSSSRRARTRTSSARLSASSTQRWPPPTALTSRRARLLATRRSAGRCAAASSDLEVVSLETLAAPSWTRRGGASTAVGSSSAAVPGPFGPLVGSH